MSFTAVAAGLGAAAGGIGSAVISNSAAVRAVKQQIRWERERAQNAHQWEVQDLQKAGLNPILSANQGATTGGISAPVPDTSGIATAGAGIGEAIKTAMDLKRTQAEIGQMGAQTNNLNKDSANKEKQNFLIDAQTIVEQYKAGLISAQAANMELKNKRDQFETDMQKLTYWNNFLNTASGTAKNVADVGMGVINRFIPKEAKKHMHSEWGGNKYGGYKDIWTNEL